MKNSKHVLALLLSVMLLLAALGGCGKNQADPTPAASDAPTETAEETPAPERADGERFEDVIMIEGMEEPVLLEHVRNETAGFEINYDYENFTRVRASDRECFVSVYDDPEHAENYLEVAYCAEDAETVEAAVSAALSKDYELIREELTLTGAGDCIRIDASAASDGSGTPDILMDVYIIPAADGCRVATAHYSFEGADGFGKRLFYMVDSLKVLDAQGERRLTGEEAVSAVRRYCLAGFPELEQKLEDGEFPVYWDVLSGDENEIVVLFRSYTGAQTYYHVDPVSGETTATVFVPGVTDEEQQTDEQLNLWDYVDWWRG